MATYISLIDYTEQGIKNIKDSPARGEGARKLAQSLGGDMKNLYLTMGGHDMVAIIDLPDDAAAARFALTVGAMGNVRTTTLRAFDQAETRDIIAQLP